MRINSKFRQPENEIMEHLLKSPTGKLSVYFADEVVKRLLRNGRIELIQTTSYGAQLIRLKP